MTFIFYALKPEIPYTPRGSLYTTASFVIVANAIVKLLAAAYKMLVLKSTRQAHTALYL